MSGKENRPGLWHNIHAKRERIARGSGERMRKPGSEGAPTVKALRESKTAAAYYAEGATIAATRLGLTKQATSINAFELPIEELRGLARDRSILKNVGAHALAGAGIGGVTGALGADPDDRVEGALRGVVGGGLAGGALGGLNEGLAELRGFSPEYITRMEGAVKSQQLKKDLAEKALVRGNSAAATQSAAVLADEAKKLKDLQDAERQILNSAHQHNVPAAVLNPLVTGGAGFMMGSSRRNDR